MKTLIFTFLFTCIAFTAFSQDTIKTEKNKPKATYQVGKAKVVVWENKKEDGTTWKNFQVEKEYKKDGEWKATNSFNESELLELKTAIEDAIKKEGIK